MIAARLREGYLRSPSVSVQLVATRPFFILGQVNQAGGFAYQTGMTVRMPSPSPAATRRAPTRDRAHHPQIGGRHPHVPRPGDHLCLSRRHDLHPRALVLSARRHWQAAFASSMCLRAPVGGLFRHVRDLARGQAAAGHDVGVVCDAIPALQPGDALLRLAAGSVSIRPPWRDCPGPATSQPPGTSPARRRAAQARHHSRPRRQGRPLRPPCRPSSRHAGRSTPLMAAACITDGPRRRACSISAPSGCCAASPTGFLFVCGYESRCLMPAGRPRRRAVAGRPQWPVAGGICAGCRRIATPPTSLFIGELRCLKGVDVLLEAIALARATAGHCGSRSSATARIARVVRGSWRGAGHRSSSCRFTAADAGAPGLAARPASRRCRRAPNPFPISCWKPWPRPRSDDRQPDVGGIPEIVRPAGSRWCRPAMPRHCWPPSRPALADPAAAAATAREAARTRRGRRDSMPPTRWRTAVTGLYAHGAGATQFPAALNISGTRQRQGGPKLLSRPEPRSAGWNNAR